MMPASRAAQALCRTATTRQLMRQKPTTKNQQYRFMGGGGPYMTVSETHTVAGEILGVAMWLWIFHRARNDLPVVLGWKHPWDH